MNEIRLWNSPAGRLHRAGPPVFCCLVFGAFTGVRSRDAPMPARCHYKQDEITLRTCPRRMWRCTLPTVVWGNSDERGALTPSRRSLGRRPPTRQPRRYFTEHLHRRRPRPRPRWRRRRDDVTSGRDRRRGFKPPPRRRRRRGHGCLGRHRRRRGHVRRRRVLVRQSDGAGRRLVQLRVSARICSQA
jgi:hypothetical protein